MTQRAGPEDLLETAARVLREEIVDGLSGKARYQALMVANAIAIAARQIGEAPHQDPVDIPAVADAASLVQAIREGTLDGRADVFDRIVARLRAEVGVSNPKALARESVDDARR
jgi:hypothetical protein